MEELSKLEPEERDVVVHEAGHAAMALRLDLMSVWVRLGWDGRGLAVTIPEFGGFSTDDNFQRVQVLMAGALAERRYNALAIDHGRLDRVAIERLLREDNRIHQRTEIEQTVQDFLEQNFNRVLAMAEVIAGNFNKGEFETHYGELAIAYHNEQNSRG